MSARKRDEHCSCGHRLRTAVELDTGLCLTCLAREDPYEGHEHCNPERAAARVDAMQDMHDFVWEKGARS